ncbi:MAG: ABC transporter substrate-binding protein [Deltaproteobacteria bacterium]|nr:ABC transporter substrate-binding protein [Deltaproteobacteria bacterium]
MKMDGKRKKLNFFFLIPLVAFTVFSSMPALCESSGEALEQLRGAVERIVDILRRNEPGEQWVDKKEEIAKIVKSRFDAEELAQRVLARNWRERTAEEKKEFISLFSEILETTYINRLKSYSDEEVVFVKQIVKGNNAVVYSEIIKNQQEIPIDYRLQNNNGNWLIYDISIEGVSLVQNYRQQFDQILNRENYAGLVLKMLEKIKQNKEKDLEEKE